MKKLHNPRDSDWNEAVFQIVNQKPFQNEDLLVFFRLFRNMTSIEIYKQSKAGKYHLDFELEPHDEESIMAEYLNDIWNNTDVYLVDGRFNHKYTRYTKIIRKYLKFHDQLRNKNRVKKQYDEFGNSIKKPHVVRSITPLLQEENSELNMSKICDLPADLIAKFDEIIIGVIDESQVKDPEVKVFLKLRLTRQNTLKEIQDAELRRKVNSSSKHMIKKIAPLLMDLTLQLYPESSIGLSEFNDFMRNGGALPRQNLDD